MKTPKTHLRVTFTHKGIEYGSALCGVPAARVRSDSAEVTCHLCQAQIRRMTGDRSYFPPDEPKPAAVPMPRSMRPLGDRLRHPETPREKVTAVRHRLEGWTVACTFQGSRGSVHTVERNGAELRCTCQGFRIRKRGYCKHTDAVKAERT